jgi:hypothetical protein
MTSGGSAKPYVRLPLPTRIMDCRVKPGNDTFVDI